MDLAMPAAKPNANGDSRPAATQKMTLIQWYRHSPTNFSLENKYFATCWLGMGMNDVTSALARGEGLDPPRFGISSTGIGTMVGLSDGWPSRPGRALVSATPQPLCSPGTPLTWEDGGPFVVWP